MLPTRRSACRSGATVGTPSTASDTATCATSARLSINQGRGAAGLGEGGDVA